MNSRVMLLLALLLVLAAGAAGYFGYRTTVEAREEVREAQQAVKEVKAAAAIESSTRIPVVVAVRPIAAFTTVTAEDIAIDHVRLEPPQTFRRLEDLLGKVLQADVPVGQLVEQQHLQPGGEIARLLRPGERAVAIAIDEVIGGGGFVQPGDSVDVLMYVPGENRPASSAQIVLRALRVVGMGSQVVAAQAIDPKPANGQTAAASDQSEARNARRQARTAVLAVTEADVTRLMLANSVGILRLAIRPADETISETGGAAPGRTSAESNRLVRTGAILPASAAAPRARSATTAARPAGPARPAEPSIVIFRGLNNNKQ